MADIDGLKPDLVKIAILNADPFIVSIVSHNVPQDMVDMPRPRASARKLKEYAYAFRGSGAIIECEEDSSGAVYIATVLTSAALFLRTNGVPPRQIQVDVYLSDGKLCKGEVFACDFHFNLAAIRIQSNFPLQTAKLRSLDDRFSLTSNDQFQSFQLRRHSDLFKVLPGTTIIWPGHCFSPVARLQHATGAFCTDNPLSEYDCKELYWIKGDAGEANNGGPIINHYGEVIGISFGSCFLPSNIVSRWWNHYKSCRGFRRPQLGVGITNLYATCLGFLEEFVNKFPNITAGVVVTKVEEDSPAYHAGIQCQDVIIKCDGLSVQTKLEFFEKIWERAGKSVQLNVLRPSTGEELNPSVTIRETPHKFYRWPLPRASREDYKGSETCLQQPITYK